MGGCIKREMGFDCEDTISDEHYKKIIENLVYLVLKNY